MVVIHADELISDHEWEVTVCDDGRGFAGDTPAASALRSGSNTPCPSTASAR